ncbi:hypothetical protein EDB85DRAFT_2284098 [Lactarius pseudohatsudake]|nr:hypothetical protein EDB85DRAFT_2284098 [Lactarius pseudohatsudake]
MVQIYIPCPYLGCRKKFIGHRGRTKHIRKVHYLRRVPTTHQATHTSAAPTQSPPGSPQRSPSPSTTGHQQPPSPPIAGPQPPPSPSATAAADTDHDNHPPVNHHRQQFHKRKHSRLYGCATDINGNTLPEATPLLHFGTLDPADPNLPPRSFAAALEIMKDLHPILLSSAFRSTPSAFISDCIFVSSAAIVVSDS